MIVDIRKYADGVDGTVTDGNGGNVEHFLLNHFFRGRDEDEVTGGGNTSLTVERLDDAVVLGEEEFLRNHSNRLHH